MIITFNFLLFFLLGLPLFHLALLSMLALRMRKPRAWNRRLPRRRFALIKGWHVQAIGTLQSGAPLSAIVSSDVSGTGSPIVNRPNLVANPNMSNPTPSRFFNPSVFQDPEEGTFGEKVDDRHPKFPWWIAFSQVRGLPEQALEGRFHFVMDWVFDYALKDNKSISVEDRAVFKEAYKSREAIRAANAWYQAFPRDILDARAYGTIQVRLLALGATGYDGMKSALSAKVENLHLVRVEDSGHFVVEEQSEFVTTQLLEFFR